MSISFRHRVIWTTVAVLLLCSCAAGDDSSMPEQPYGESLPVSIRAMVADVLYSRGYQEFGQVTNGEYYLTYESKGSTSGNRTYALATVLFDNTETGLATKTGPGNNRLEWKDVVNTTSTFRLDNVPLSLDTAPESEKSDTLVVFGTGIGENPFVAGIFDDNDGKNDLLWGSKEVGYNMAQIHFDLHHYMSRVKVVVTANKKNSADDALNLDGAEVKITSLVLTPKSYNRLNGALDLGEEPEYKDLILTSKEIGWAETPDTEKPNEEYLDIRTTHDFVLPPQSLLDNDRRPRLVITLTDGSVYSGILPHAMEVVTGSTLEDGTQVTYPVALAFLREHILTLRTVITEDPPELSFMPVTVIEWVDKGDFALEGHQAGIYNSDDFITLVKNYETYSEEQLERFGLNTDARWEFNFWGHVEVNENLVKGKMKVTEGKKDFTFKFHGYTCKVGNTEYSQANGNTDNLVTLLKGN